MPNQSEVYPIPASPLCNDNMTHDDHVCLALLEDLYCPNTEPDYEHSARASLFDSSVNDQIQYTQYLMTSPPIQNTKFRPVSVFYPTKSKGSCIDAFYRIVHAEIQEMCISGKNKTAHNLTQSEKKALEALTNNFNLTIKSADKGGGIVVQNRLDYVTEANRLLSDSNTYMKLQTDPLPRFTIEAASLVKDALRDVVITKYEASFLVGTVHFTPYFYHLPKVHKNQTNPPGRPIVAAMGSITSGFSQYVDQFLQPLAQSMQSYIRDGTHLLQLLSPYSWEPTYLWVSLDVQSLYTSIPHDVGLRAVQSFLCQDPLLNSRQASFILEATAFCLTHNYFQFEKDFFLQVNGTAMGANFAPSYANITMGYWESSYIWHNNPFSSHIVFYGRYIDDVIIIWDGSVSSVSDFVAHCNNNNMGLNFTSVIDEHQLAFLDLELFFIGKDIHAKNFTKPTAGNSFLNYKSCHHPQWLNNIPKSQYCRLKKNCTRDTDYETQSKILEGKFLDKEFPADIVKTAYSFYKDTSISSRPKIQADTNNKNDIRFITQFHSRHRQMEGIVRKHWPLLLQDEHLVPALPKKPKFAYRKAPNIKGKVAPSKLKEKPLPPGYSIPTFLAISGMYQCRKPLCKTCRFVKHGQKDFCVKGKTYPIKGFQTCSSDHVVYCLTCPCGLFYVG